MAAERPSVLGDRRFIRTVLGDIDPADLGVTYAHEHLIIAEDELLDHVVLGMDAARRGYYSVYGGRPGFTWLLDGFSTAMDERDLGADVRRRLFVDNPARVFAFAIEDGGAAA